MANGHKEEALAVMAKYHGEGDVNSPIVQLEYKEMLGWSFPLLISLIILTYKQRISQSPGPISDGGITESFSTPVKYDIEPCWS